MSTSTPAASSGAVSGSGSASASPSPSLNLARLHNKVVFITGASAGIGRATAVLFARLGANVVLTARRTALLDDVAAECLAAHAAAAAAASLPAGVGGKVHAASMDMRSRASIDAVLGSRSGSGLPAWAHPASVDVLVNSAGLVLGVDNVGHIDPDEVDTMVQTNVVGLIHLTQAFVRLFKARRPSPAGHVINLGSIAGREAYPGGSIYCATKFAVSAFTSALMKELVDTPIRVSEVQPGMVETDFSLTRFRGDSAAAAKVYEGLDPLTPADVAEEIAWIASRPRHVNNAQTLLFPVNQASPYHNFRPGKQQQQ